VANIPWNRGKITRIVDEFSKPLIRRIVLEVGIVEKIGDEMCLENPPRKSMGRRTPIG